MSILNRKLLNTKMVPTLGLKSPSQMGFFYCCTRKWVFWNLRSEEKEKKNRNLKSLFVGGLIEKKVQKTA
jgi:hypothetical protein